MAWAPPRSRGLEPETVQRLDRYVCESLACPAAVARRGGVHVVATAERLKPAWLGYSLPVIAIAYPEGAAIAVRPDMAAPLRAAMGSDLKADRLDHAAVSRLRRHVERLVALAYVLGGDARAVDRASFIGSASEGRAERIDPADPAAAHIRHRFDGAVFGIRGPRGSLISWAALKLKSNDVWEVAVATEADYRARGYGRDVVSAATRHTLEQGRLCLYVHDHENTTSAFVARSLGYQTFAEIVLAEF